MADNIPKWEDSEEIKEDKIPTWDESQAVEQAETDSAFKFAGDIAGARSPIDYAAGSALTLGKKGLNLLGGEFNEDFEANVQQAQDARKGFVQGATMNAEDEVKGAIGAGVAKLRGDERSLGDLYRQYQKLEENRLKEAKERNPTATTVGEIGGSVAAGLATAGAGLEGQIAKKLGTEGLKEAAKRGFLSAGKEVSKQAAAAGAESALFGGIQGGLASEQTLEDPSELGKDILAGATFGAAGGAASKAIPGLAQMGTQASKETAESILSKTRPTRQAMEVFKRSASGKPVGNEAIGEIDEGYNALLKRFKGAEDEAGSAVGAARKAATESGFKVNLADTLEQASSDLQAYAKNSPQLNIENNPAYKKILIDLYLIKSDQLSPEQAVTMRDSMQKLADSTRDPQIAKIAGDVRSSIKAAIDQDPGLAKANKSFSEIKRFGRETLGAQGTQDPRIPGAMSQVDDDKLKNSIKWAVDKLSTPGLDAKDQLETLNYMSKNPEIMNALGVKNMDELKNLFQNDLAGIRGILEGGSGIGPAIPGMSPEALARGITATGFKALYKGAQFAGKGAGQVQNKVLATSKALYNAPDAVLNPIADMLISSGIPGSEAAGKFLQRALQNKDVAAKNAALFTMQQDPKIRKQIREIMRMEEDNEQ